MYKLTPRMAQSLRHELGRFHQQFSGGRCAGWQLEELIVKAIKSDTTAQHHVLWKEGGHDDQADIVVRTGREEHQIQIKSGKQNKPGYLDISGHRLGRFEGDLTAISCYLNNKRDSIISVAHRAEDGEDGRSHIYELRYIRRDMLRGLSASGWEERGKQFVQINHRGVEFSLRPSMSWQIWWRIPITGPDHVFRLD